LQGCANRIDSKVKSNEFVILVIHINSLEEYEKSLIAKTNYGRMAKVLRQKGRKTAKVFLLHLVLLGWEDRHKKLI